MLPSSSTLSFRNVFMHNLFELVLLIFAQIGSPRILVRLTAQNFGE